MTSLRSSAPSAPRSPLARLVLAAFPSRSFSDAVNWRRILGATDSCDASFTLGSRGLRSSAAGTTSRPGTWVGLGTFWGPFFAHRYRDIRVGLSQVTLAQRATPPTAPAS